MPVYVDMSYFCIQISNTSSERIKKHKRFSAVFEYIAIPAHSGYLLYLKREWVKSCKLTEIENILLPCCPILPILKCMCKTDTAWRGGGGGYGRVFK
jgi:hypothetical protein